MEKIKPNFSIREIGKFRFYSGILIGLIFSLILNSFFQQLIKVNYAISAIYNENWETPLASESNFYYSFFYGLFAISLAFCFTTYMWMSKVVDNNRRKTRAIRTAQANSFFIFGIIFYVSIRFFTTLNAFDLDSFAVDLQNYFGISLFVLPLFIFSYNWTFICRIYKSKRISLYSLFIFIIYGLILSGIKM